MNLDIIIDQCQQLIRRHRVNGLKLLTDLENTHHGLSYQVLYDMVLSISQFDLGGYKFQLGEPTMKVKTYRYPKLIS
jgi:hypothetical protein